MSMSDCEFCWSTPCTCGRSGYMVVFPTPNDCAQKMLRQRPIPAEQWKALNDELRLLLDQRLAELSQQYPPKFAEVP